MDECTTLQAHLDRIQEIRDQFSSIARWRKRILWLSLFVVYQSPMSILSRLNITSSGVDLKFTDLCTLLLQQDQWKQQFGSSSTSTSTSTKQSFQKDKGKFQQPSKQNSSALASYGSEKKNIQCNYCHKIGHMKVKCRKRLATQSKQSSSQPKENSAKHTE